MKLLIDTSSIVNFLRGKQGSDILWREINSKGDLFVSIITKAELLYGTYRSGNPNAEKKKTLDLISDFNIGIAPLNDDIVDLYAVAKTQLEKAGNRLDEFDLLIGATAVASGSMLVTDNQKHFRRFPNLTLYPQ
ncbi:type II toxin-antitoxin system VapC family toxin [Candidatus Collierbacteria bacterium]|nr:type II toxin-antitoxin system VapC family toxin [Candidatus Collierbacteria bacterium]